MVRDYFAILGLTPGRYAPAEVTRRFCAERQSLLAQLDDPATHRRARRQLDELHVAYAVLRDPHAQAECLRAGGDAGGEHDDIKRLRRLIAASLEDGLLRYSRRQGILAQAQRIGLSPFQAQLLIAQVQFGDDRIHTPVSGRVRREPEPSARTWARFAAAGVLALAMFLAMVRWLGA